jgi:hypothetical protein
MKHIVHACALFEPENAVLVVPESALFSELDETARAFLRRRFRLRILDAIDDDVFGGVRARTHLIRLERTARPVKVVPGVDTKNQCEIREVTVVRGSLQMFRVEAGETPFLHTTDLTRVEKNGLLEHELRHVRRFGGGQVRGHFLLVPRVGNPPRGYRPRLLFSRSDIQLSDCLIALKFKNKQDGVEFADELCERW